MAAIVSNSERQLHMGTISKLKEGVREAINNQHDQLLQLSHDIHEHPELAFYEEYAAARLTQFLAEAGFTVHLGVAGMPTAFTATIGNGPLHVAFCAEYDALPPACIGAISNGGTASEQGKPQIAEVWLNETTQKQTDAPLRHACGHNLIAGSAVTAAMGLRDIADRVGLTVSVFGTPGEELCGLPEPPEGRLSGGKVELFKAGAFQNVHAAFVAHPGPTPFSLFYPTHVYLRLRSSFSPARVGQREMGIAALQALKETLERAVLGLRQVPALFVARPETQETGAQVDLLVIASSSSTGMQALNAVRDCFERAASAAGVRVEITNYTVNAELRNDPMLSAAYRENSRILGRERESDEHVQEEIRQIFSSPQLPLATRLVAPLLRAFPRLVAPPGLFLDKIPTEMLYGTDLAPVSQVIPCIHPLFGIGGLAGPHSVEFAAQADSDEAYRAMLDTGVALAWTALDAATNPVIKAHLLEADLSSRL